MLFYCKHCHFNNKKKRKLCVTPSFILHARANTLTYSFSSRTSGGQLKEVQLRRVILFFLLHCCLYGICFTCTFLSDENT